jgi:cysteine desulfurase
MSRPVYLDSAATTPPDPRVVDLMQRYLTGEFGNAGSRTHEYGDAARRAVERARDQVAQVIGVRRSAVIFTSGATEANNLAIFGTAPRHIVTTQIEHPSVMEPICEMESRGCEVTRIAPTASGTVRAAGVLAAIRPDTGLVSAMFVNNETGAIQPVREIAEGLSATPSVRLHVDAAQGFGKLPGQLDHPRIDYISVSAHKIGGPQGIGALIAQRQRAPDGPAKLRPITFGGGQEGGLRPGTVPAHLIAGFGLAAELALRENTQRIQAAVALKNNAIAAFRNAHIHGDLDQSSPFILNLAFPGLTNEEVIDAWRVIAAVSNGAACASARNHCSYVLNAMGIPDSQAAGAIRLSWYPSSGHALSPDFHRMAEVLRGRVA